MMILDQPLAGVGRVNSWRAIFAIAGFFLAGAFGSGVAAQSVAPIAVPPAKADAAQENPNATKTTKKHKVFTDDDVFALRAKGGLANDDDAGSAMIYGAIGACDANCEREIKEKLEITPEQEGEWKLQLTAARREIGEDRVWREIYAKGQQTMRTVCALRVQIENASAPSGSDYQSRLERAKQQKMFEDEATAMGQQMSNSIAAMNQHIVQFSAREPVRAAMMTAIGERLFNDCADGGGK
jgi:hypothetical protein